MGELKDGLKGLIDVTSGIAGMSALIIDVLTKLALLAEKNRVLRQLLENENIKMREVDEKLAANIESKLKQKNIYFEKIIGTDEQGNNVPVIIFPKDREREVDEIFREAAIEAGLISEVSKEDLCEIADESNLLVMKNIDIDLAYRIKDYAKNEGLTVAIDLEDDATCTLYALEQHSDELAMACVLANFELKSELGYAISQKTLYERNIENEYNKLINAEKEVYIMDKQGYPMLHIDDERCDFSYKDEKGIIRTESVLRADEVEFNQKIGEGLAQIKETILMTPNEFYQNENDKGKTLNKKIEQMPKLSEEHEKVEEYLKQIQENYREKIKEEKEKDELREEALNFKQRAEDFRTHVRNDLFAIKDFPINVDTDLLEDVDRGIEQVKVDVMTGKEVMEIRNKLEALNDIVDPMKDFEEEKGEKREERSNKNKDKDRDGFPNDREERE